MEAIPHDPHHNHRDSPVINAELASAVSVGSKTLSAFRPGDLGVREKLRLASTCTAKYEEDTAYSLFGIFASDGDISWKKSSIIRVTYITVAWTGSSSGLNSCLPAEIAVYKEPPQTVSPIERREQAENAGCGIAVPIAAGGSRGDLWSDFESTQSIVLAVNKLTRVAQGPQWHVHHAPVSMPGDVGIRTADPRPLQEPRGLLLVHPWIRIIS